MAEKHLEAEKDGGIATETDIVNSGNRTSKRCSSTRPAATTPPHKSPRTEFPSPTLSASDTGKGQPETDQQEMQTENTEEPSISTVSPIARRKSWRRATITRRSLPALQNPYKVLCRSINPSLPQQERFEKLIEASFKLAIERTQNSLQSVPNASIECFHKQVEHIWKECDSLAKNLCSESHDNRFPPSTVSDPARQVAMEKAIKRLEAESESWEALLNKHQKKAQELEWKVEQGKEKGVVLDSTSIAKSSQYHFITSKPDYHGLLHRQKPMFHAVAMIMETQCKMVRKLLSIKEQSQVFVKETSGRLAAEAGFQDLSADVVKNLMTAPLSATTT
ncbi:kinetochore-associated protein DSN1 homolog isoform X2 [Cheilinus undulatus]|uniref:kinetochore-associated protein DSN1 homolog isoform X2 n=1 Tax=Cheilinus undulatus TaxID=241271 RepID=UPI001BD534D3|nr:kinetochore-associated protein DSN1 homolog isoform X2 [Cheilinus undulatus]